MFRRIQRSDNVTAKAKLLKSAYGHTVEFTDANGIKRKAKVDLYTPADDGENGLASISVDDGIVPNWLYETDVHDLKILD